MKLSRLVINNFLSFGTDVVVDFTKTNPPVLIQGVTSALDKSNGAGKSSMFEAFYWALSGKLIRGITATEVIRKGAKTCTVLATFSFNSKEIQVIRTYSESRKHVVINVDGLVEEFHDSKQGTQRLFEILGITPEILSLVCFLGKKFQTFSSLRPSERADLIDVLAQGSKWEQARIVAATSAKSLEKDYSQLVSQRDSTKAMIQTFTDSMADKSSELDRRKKITNEELARLSEIEKKISNEVSELETTLKQHPKPIDKLTAINAVDEEITETQSKISVLDKLCYQLEQTIKVNKGIKSERFDENKYEQEKKKLSNEIETGICSSCGQPLPHNHDDTKSLDRLADIEESLIKERTEFNQRISNVLNDLDLDSKKLQEKVSLKESLQDEIKDFKEYKITLQQEAIKADSERVRIDNNLNDSKRDLSQIKSDILKLKNDTQTTILSRDIENLTKRIQEEESKYKELEVIVSGHGEQLLISKYWAQGFNDIRYGLFNDTVASLQELVSSYLSQQGLDFTRVEIDTWKVTSDKRNKPEINLRVVRGEDYLSIDALSEGETQRVDIACFLAIGTLVQQSLGCTLDLAVLDEPFSGIDGEGKEKIFDILHELSDHRQIFIIDHDSLFKSLFTNVITVLKPDKGTSSVEIQ